MKKHGRGKPKRASQTLDETRSELQQLDQTIAELQSAVATQNEGAVRLHRFVSTRSDMIRNSLMSLSFLEFSLSDANKRDLARAGNPAPSAGSGLARDAVSDSIAILELLGAMDGPLRRLAVDLGRSQLASGGEATGLGDGGPHPDQPNAPGTATSKLMDRYAVVQNLRKQHGLLKEAILSETRRFATIGAELTRLFEDALPGARFLTELGKEDQAEPCLGMVAPGVESARDIAAPLSGVRITTRGVEIPAFAEHLQNQLAPVALRYSTMPSRRADARVSVAVDESISPQLSRLWFDPHQVESILRSVVKNAAEAGATQIDVAVKTEAGQLIISVQDNGPGLSDNELALIGQPGAPFGKPNGHGFELAIAKRIMVLHKGDLSVTSPTGDGASGAKVTISMPADHTGELMPPTASSWLLDN